MDASGREGRDVYAVAAEYRSDVADDACLIRVANHDHRPVERRLNGNAVQEHDPRGCPLEDGALGP